MQKSASWISSIRQTILVSGLILGIGLTSNTAIAAGSVDPEADKIVRAMSSYMGKLTAFSVDLGVDDEILDTTGRKLQFSASTSLVVRRPDKLYSHRQGPVADLELFFNGKSLTLHGKGLNVYGQMDIVGTLDHAIGQVRTETGLSMPAGDLLYTDSYTGLMDGVVSGDYVGTGFVDGVQCHHLAFRQEKVDWQLWVQVGDTPLPMKYVITSKWVTGAPQFTARFRNWNNKPEISADRFELVPPEGAEKIQDILVDEMGELMLKGE